MQSNKNTYTFQGIRLKNEESKLKIQQINQINRSNNQLLTCFKLDRGNTQFQFPDKLSQNLSDIYTTCVIQNKLIKEIKDLHQSYTQLQSKRSSQFNQRNIQMQEFKRSINDYQKTIKNLTKRNLFLEELQKRIKLQESQIIKLKREKQQYINKFEYLERQLKKKQIEQQKYIGKKNDPFIKKDWKKNIEIIDNINFPNSQCNKQQIKIKDYVKDLWKDQWEKQKKFFQEENQKLKDWIKKFVQSIERILKIRLKKLREMDSNQQPNSVYQYLPKMHLNTISHSFKSSQFPFGQLLHDFEYMMRQAEENKFQHGKVLMLSKTEILNREIVQLVVNELIKFKSVLVQEFVKCGEKRYELAKEYINLLEFDESSLELIRNTTIEKIRQFMNNPQRLMKQIEDELANFRKYRKQIESNNQQNLPDFLKRRMEISQQIKNIVADLKDKQKQERINQQYFKEQQQLQLKNRQQFKKQNELLGGTEEEKAKREKKQLYEERKKFVMDILAQKSNRNKNDSQNQNYNQKQYDENKQWEI